MTADSTVEERMAARKEAEDNLRAGLASISMEGPHQFPDGSPLGMMFGARRDKFAVCLKCGAMIVLNDHTTTDEGKTIERSASLHAQWHAGLDDA